MHQSKKEEEDVVIEEQEEEKENAHGVALIGSQLTKTSNGGDGEEDFSMAAAEEPKEQHLVIQANEEKDNVQEPTANIEQKDAGNTVSTHQAPSATIISTNMGQQRVRPQASDAPSIYDELKKNISYNVNQSSAQEQQDHYNDDDQEEEDENHEATCLVDNESYVSVDEDATPNVNEQSNDNYVQITTVPQDESEPAVEAAKEVIAEPKVEEVSKPVEPTEIIVQEKINTCV